MGIPSRREYLRSERRRATRIVRLLIGLFDVAIDEARKDGGEMAYKEHEELIDAYRNGLNWWINHEGGVALYERWLDYLNVLKEMGYEGDIFAAAFEEEGIS